MKTTDIICDFFNQVDAVFGMYLDATMALKMMGFEIDKNQQETSGKLKLSIEYLDTLPHIYGKGDPNSFDCIVYHETTQGEFKKRISEGGENHAIISHVCITQIYQYWEDHYRGLISRSIGINKHELKSDVFGDLRIYRNSIVHHKAIALPEIEKCKILKWHNTGDEIKFNNEQVKEIIMVVKSEINDLYAQYCI